MTFLQLQNAVVDNINRTDKTSVVQNGINFGLQEIAKAHEWLSNRFETDLVIAAGDLSVPLPATMHKLVEARLINPSATVLSYPMVIIPKMTFVKTYPNVVAYGAARPFVGYEELGTLFFFPKSSDVFTIRVTCDKLPATLTNDGDVNPLVETDQALIAYATAHVFRSVQMFEAAAVWDGQFKMSLGNALNAEKRRVATSVRLQEFHQDSSLETSPIPWLDPFAGRGGNY